MPDPIDDFFAALGRSGHVPLLARFTGSMRFELRANGETQRWRVGIDNGNIRVTRDGEGSVDAVISGERALLVPIVRGRMRPLCAFLRNEIAVTGEFRMLLVLERLLPGPSGRDPRDLVAGRRERESSSPDGGEGRDRAAVSGRRP
ncbi:SCP2 sterol-binding domain-containing protein [Rugosimonospora africana]|uniref:SCP2 domain-containing protein n=1 Tax=Rugosimonospora africana TaxID=556532 RepID=A0A8J3VPX0_9ACTN|nr:SCP2 sterol-binding domain-containing protein [Rugosimonospora africana]GIH14545.1 hypothetical protein Raf01_27170 [Rugosimonospora africana]